MTAAIPTDATAAWSVCACKHYVCYVRLLSFAYFCINLWPLLVNVVILRDLLRTCSKSGFKQVLSKKLVVIVTSWNEPCAVTDGNVTANYWLTVT